jgi:hypothetical protein
MIDIEEVKRLNIGPNDTLVVQIAGPILDIGAVIKYIHDAVPGLENRVLVIDESVSLAVVSSEGALAHACGNSTPQAGVDSNEPEYVESRESFEERRRQTVKSPALHSGTIRDAASEIYFIERRAEIVRDEPS